MKATGIVRRIDDLGRVVIPKEIRRTQMIRVGDPLDSPIGELAVEAAHLVEALYKNAGVPALVTDRDKVVAASGILRPGVGRSLDGEYSSRMENRRVYTADGEKFAVCSGLAVTLMAPVLSSGDLIGSVAVLASDTVSPECAGTLARVSASFLGRRLEE